MLYTEERQKQQLSMDFSKRRGEYSGKVGIAEKLARAWRDDALETGPYGERGGGEAIINRGVTLLCDCYEFPINNK